MDLREPTADDAERIADVVESSMTASHSLSPQQIDRIVDSEFGGDAVSEKLDGETTLVRVAERGENIEGEAVVGYVEGVVDGDTGELSWLFVDPEHRGRGVGTALFESMREALRDAGASTLRATVLDANTEGGQFFERFGLEHAEERDLSVGDESLVEVVFADPSTVDAGDDEQPGDAGGDDLPGTETEDGTTTATTEDGQSVVVARDERESGTDAPFFVVYTDDSREDRYGYYCANCGSLDVTMDDTERLECPDCGNDHAERSSDAYDDSYL
ncbi:GNAT family N-acetyltransferase [Halobacterium jilantaiense]|uniref:Ribosomal protein S18 acetylase RimI n=1 Tax=Halobacterium jilantaiense TaxID=355548 RepID=A0A1I0QDT4_9EURY|nr:GNAT family N-acetyltransferase [Halobacterium jilantaiense]SEW25206.1 Ribosomal protein S18 acetylase RimI [Halobacterium jilantaiense]